MSIYVLIFYEYFRNSHEYQSIYVLIFYEYLRNSHEYQSICVHLGSIHIQTVV